MVLARAGECETLLHQMREEHRGELVSHYENGDTDPLPFRLACFGDYGGEGEVCWDVARGSDAAVLVLCTFTEGDWWRSITAKAEPIFADTRGFGVGEAHVIYRVTHRDVLKQLWSHASRDDNIATVCVPDNVSPQQIMGMATAYSAASLLSFATHYGWIYTQRYGGGANEHYAQFATRDSRLALAAYLYAHDRAAKDSGWWELGML